MSNIQEKIKSITKVKEDDNTINCFVQIRSQEIVCERCGCDFMVYHSKYKKRKPVLFIKDNKIINLFLYAPRIRCPHCHHITVFYDDFLEDNKLSKKRLLELVEIL